MTDERCPACGAEAAGGEPGCDARFLAFTDRVRRHPALAPRLRLIVDAYAMQHAERYAASAKSYAAHLTGLCCVIEHDANPAINAAILEWLDGRVALEKPERIGARGTLTIADVDEVATPEEQSRRVLHWAESVWAAYEPQHALARRWIAQALDRTSRPRPRAKH